MNDLNSAKFMIYNMKDESYELYYVRICYILYNNSVIYIHIKNLVYFILNFKIF